MKGPQIYGVNKSIIQYKNKETCFGEKAHTGLQNKGYRVHSRQKATTGPQDKGSTCSERITFPQHQNKNYYMDKYGYNGMHKYGYQSIKTLQQMEKVIKKKVKPILH